MVRRYTAAVFTSKTKAIRSKKTFSTEAQAKKAAFAKARILEKKKKFKMLQPAVLTTGTKKGFKSVSVRRAK